MPDVVVVGEALIDMVSDRPGVSIGEAPGFRKCPGGAPANVAVGLARLGASVGFVGVVGDDPFGRYLKAFLRQNGVDVTYMRVTKEALTTLAFVALGPRGETEFSFYRRPGADTLVSPEDLSPAYLASARLFHFGTVSMAEQPSQSAVWAGIERAAAAGLSISLDVNYRPALWADPAQALVLTRRALEAVHLLKTSGDELEMLSGSRDEAGARRLLDDYSRLSLVVVTEGPQGSWAVTRGGAVARAAAFEVEAVDTTGAGDAFWAAALWQLLGLARRAGRSPKEVAAALDAPALRRLLATANAAGALTVQVQGAMTALPTREELDRFTARIAS
ncbi:carbohydrate kinase [Carboxydochorda subterranea]|uniref:Carbohydrate kinase n=1 Tax=Carboxydichorda subterranea TaxID=3109565 RepID=A0ABZ1BYM1_9FIRM|nr:carbohydrate kinase [Limnochorda sp. L945t]WRP17167.1 carbohydrate kinase [Limnochorda sp. L945t]